MMAELAARVGRPVDSRKSASPRARAGARLRRRARQSRHPALSPAPRPRGARLARPAGERGEIADAHQNLRAAALGRIGGYDEAIAIYRDVLAAPSRPAQTLDEPRAICSRPSATRTKRSPPIAARSRSRRRWAKRWWSLANLKTVRFARCRPRGDGSGARRAGARRRRPRSTSISRSARRMRIAARMKPRGAIMPRAMRLRRAELGTIRREITRWSTASSPCSTRDFFAERARPGPPRRRPDLHPWHAARRIDPGRANPGQPQPGRRDDGVARHLIAIGRGGWMGRTAPIPRCLASAGWRRSSPGSAANISSGRGSTAADRQAVLHRQDAQQLGACRVDPPDPAQREDHRRAAPSARLRLFQFQAALSRAARRSVTTLATSGTYYADYVRLMAHLDRVQPGAIHRVIHERLVDDPEARSARFARRSRAGVRTGLPALPRE